MKGDESANHSGFDDFQSAAGDGFEPVSGEGDGEGPANDGRCRKYGSLCCTL